MADAIVTKAAQKAKGAIENAACHNPETKLQSALGEAATIEGWTRERRANS